MTSNPLDPELHVLRSVARSLDGRARSELETARFNLWQSLRFDDRADAVRWARACRAALVTLPDGDGRALAVQALDAIESELGHA